MTTTYTITANVSGEVRATGLTAEEVAVWLSNRYDTSRYTVTADTVAVAQRAAKSA